MIIPYRQVTEEETVTLKVQLCIQTLFIPGISNDDFQVKTAHRFLESDSPYPLNSHFKDLFVLALLVRLLRSDRAMIGP